MDIAARATRLAADNAAYFDTTIEDATETIYSFIKGNYENDAALNLVANEMARNTAANERYGKSFQELNGLQQADTLLSMAEAANELSGAYGQASREASSWANVTGELKEYVELRQKLEEKKNPVKEEFESVAEAAAPATEAIDKIAEAYANAKEAARESLDSQIGYFEAVNLESDMSAQKIMENWQSQQEAFANYTANLQKAMDMGLDDILIKQLSDGSAESMIMLDALVNDYAVSAEEINSSWNKTAQMRDTTADVLAGIQEDLTGMTGAVDSAVVGSAESTKTGITNALTDAASTIQNTAFAPMEESGTATSEQIGEGFDDAANTMKAAWGDMGPWFNANVVTPIKTGIEGITQSMSESLSSMKAETESAWASMVSTVENSINKMQSSINGLTGKRIDITVNKTGNGANLVSYSGYDGLAYSPEAAAYTPATLDYSPTTYPMPYLATGAVIPPMAISSISAKSSGMAEENLDALAQKIAAAVAVSVGTIDVHNSVNFEGSLAQLGRVLKPVIDTETRRVGKSLAVEKVE